jgi:hypothetical protein
VAKTVLCTAALGCVPSGNQARGCGLSRPLLVDGLVANHCLAVVAPMTSQPREYVWKAPYKPARAAEDASTQGPSTSRRTSSISPRSQPVSAAPLAEDQFSFHFPESDTPGQSDALGGRQFLQNQSPPTPNMSDPTTIHEVGAPNFFLEKQRGPGASSYSFLPLLTTVPSQTEKQKMIASLRNHTVNTLSELRRIERVFATMGTSDVTEPMTTACTRQNS